jgi:hypothetical protein
MQQIHDANEKVVESLAKYQREGSGWNLDKIIHVEVHTAKYAPQK